MNIVIMSPTPKSSYALLVAQKCLAMEGITLKGVIVSKMLNPKRIKNELSRDGIRLIKKAWNKLVLNADKEVFYNTVKPKYSSLCTLCKENNIPIIKVSSYNSPKTIAFVKGLKTDVIAYTGGGLIREAMLNTPTRGIINLHMGVLPQYRGMDVVEWGILDSPKAQPQLGITAMLMDVGIDTGPIIKIVPFIIEKSDTVKAIRHRMLSEMPDIMADCICTMQGGRQELKKQTAEDGRQYYIMHDRLIKLTEQKLKDIN